MSFEDDGGQEPKWGLVIVSIVGMLAFLLWVAYSTPVWQ
jgi:hypothetical protein